jgi:multidrug efflux pump subunit AcrB
MNLIRFALRKPVSILVLVAGLFIFGIGAIRDIKVDILPKMNLPVLYLAHPFGGYTPNQMESYFAKNYVNIMLFANGVKAIETKNIQGLTLMKVTYYEHFPIGFRQYFHQVRNLRSSSVLMLLLYR